MRKQDHENCQNTVFAFPFFRREGGPGLKVLLAPKPSLLCSCKLPSHMDPQQESLDAVQAGRRSCSPCSRSFTGAGASLEAGMEGGNWDGIAGNVDTGMVGTGMEGEE